MSDKNYKPLEIKIERNPNIDNDVAFIVTINGKRLENVMKFSLDLDNEKLCPLDGKGHRDYGQVPIRYNVEFYEDLDDLWNWYHKGE